MSDQLLQKLSRLYNSKSLPWILIGIGIALRLIRYLYNPSLWFDEADIAIDIIQRPIPELIHPSPDYSQAYPLAFLTIIKLFTQVFGNSEFVLRLFPFLSGIISLFLFYKIAKHYIEPKAIPISLGLFAVLDPLVIQSSELKPYSSDVLFVLLIYTMVIYIQSKKLNMPRIILFGISGAIIVWCSNPSVFVLAGVGACLGVFAFDKRDWSTIGKLLVVYTIWSLSFIANYFFYIRNLQANFNISMKEMLSVMENAYMPLPPKSLADIKWFVDLFFEIFNNPLAMTLTGISVLAFLVGCASIYLRNRRSFFLLIAPMLFAFLAAALHQYIFKGRFIFFLSPLFLLIIADGTEYIRSRTVKVSKIIGIIFISLLIFHPVTISAYRIKKPFYFEDIKPVLNYVKDHWQEGDVLYVHYFAQYPFLYYSQYYPKPYTFNEDDYVIGIAPRGWYRHWRKTEVTKYYDPDVPIQQSSIEIFKIYARDLDRLKGNNRVWVLFTMAVPKDGILEEKFFVYHLETIGTQLDSFGLPGVSSVYLYDLSGPASFKEHR